MVNDSFDCIPCASENEHLQILYASCVHSIKRVSSNIALNLFFLLASCIIYYKKGVDKTDDYHNLPLLLR